MAPNYPTTFEHCDESLSLGLSHSSGVPNIFYKRANLFVLLLVGQELYGGFGIKKQIKYNV